MRMIALFLSLLVAHHHANTVKGFVTCPSHYYYDVQPQAKSPHHRPLLDTLQKVADSYEVPLFEVVEYNPIAAKLATLPMGMEICIPYPYV